MSDDDRLARNAQKGGPLRRWWRQADHFDWLTSYLHARGLANATKLLMALISGALVLMAVNALTMWDAPLALEVTYSVAAVTIGLGYGTLWLRGWPTETQSRAMVWLGVFLMAAGCMMQSHAMLGLMGCTAMAILGGYAAFFHGAKAITLTVLIATIAGTYCALRAAEVDGWIGAVTGLWLVIEINLAVPLAIQAVVRTLGADVVRSDHDPLTGVLNRRAFYERASTLLTSPGEDLHLVVVMIDLDKFKRLNDEYGHLAGDQALTAVGWVLRETADSSAVVGRFGGEEFIVIDAVPADSADVLPDKLCKAIAALPQPVTASVGAAIVRWASCGLTMEDLIRSADAAMYAAKSAGGNQTRVHRVGSPAASGH